jgi:hypothetical protein
VHSRLISRVNSITFLIIFMSTILYRYDDAMTWNEKALRAAQTQRGIGHVSVVAIKNDMADILLSTGRVEEAIGVLYSVVCLQRELHKGADSPDIALVRTT